MTEKVKEQRIVHGYGFAMMYHAMTRDKRISHGAFRLYAHLLEYAWSGLGWPGMDGMSDALDVHRTTASTWMKELVAAGYVTRERKAQGLTSITYIEDPESNAGLIAAVLNALEERELRKELREASRSVDATSQTRRSVGATAAVVPRLPQSSSQGYVEEEIDEGEIEDKKDPDTPFGVSEDEPKYVGLEDDWPEEDTRGNLEGYIYRQANRRLTPNQAAKMRKPVVGRRQYQSPEQIFSRADMPLFKRWIDEQIAWAQGGNDEGKRMTTGNLVGAIRNYERPYNGWLEFYQKEGELSGDERLGGTGQRTDADRRREAEAALAGLSTT